MWYSLNIKVVVYFPSVNFNPLIPYDLLISEGNIYVLVNITMVYNGYPILRIYFLHLFDSPVVQITLTQNICLFLSGERIVENLK